MHTNAAENGIAIVTPWFGPDLTGGGERLAWQVTQGLAQRGHAVEVLTTCSRSFASNWGSNYHASGAERSGTLTIRRFPVDPRDADAFDRANALLLATPLTRLRPMLPSVCAEASKAFVTHNICSSRLVSYLTSARDSYRAVIFLPYLYGTTLHALEAVKDKAFLHPLLHDEPYAYLPHVEACVHQARGLLFMSDGEFLLAKRLYGPGIIDKSHVIGNWIDPPLADASASQRTALEATQQRYVLYLGRRDETKNLGMLIEAFREYRFYHQASTLKLVLAGPGATPFSDPQIGIIDLGYVSEDTKHALLARALALFQPSYNESYSRAMMEAWSHARPVVVHEHCLSTALAVERSGGGWIASTKRSWVHAFQELDYASPEELDETGKLGRRYYEAHSTPERVLERYEAALFSPPSPAISGAFDACSDRARSQLPPHPTRLWDIVPDATTLCALRDAPNLIVSIGTMGLSETQHEIIAAFSFLLAMQCDARLVFIGGASTDEHAAALTAFIAQQNLSQHIHVAGACSREQLAAYYRCASLLCALDDDQTLYPLLDAMWFDIPILALATPLREELLGQAGILVTTREEPAKLGALMKLLLRDEKLRTHLLAAQHGQRQNLHHHILERHGGEPSCISAMLRTA